MNRLFMNRFLGTRFGSFECSFVGVLCLASAACQSEETLGTQPTTTGPTSSSPMTGAASSTGSSATPITSTNSGATNAVTSAGETSAGTQPNTSSTTDSPTSLTTNGATGSTSVTGTESSASSSAMTSGEGEGSATASSGSGEPTMPSDACATALLCDNFDDDAVGMAPGQPWKTEASQDSGTIAVSNERAFSGDKSVHVTNTAGAYKRAYFSLDGAPVFPGAGSELYGRMMMWLDVAPADGVHWTFIQGEGPAEGGAYDIFYRYGGQHQGKLMANFETQGVASDCWNHSQTVMPTKTWACLEWRFATATDEMQFWLDGTELDDLHVVGQGNEGSGCVAQDWSGMWPAPQQFEVLRLGMEKYQQDGALNLWIDDVAVATSRVGCPTPE